MQRSLQLAWNRSGGDPPNATWDPKEIAGLIFWDYENPLASLNKALGPYFLGGGWPSAPGHFNGAALFPPLMPPEVNFKCMKI